MFFLHLPLSCLPLSGNAIPLIASRESSKLSVSVSVLSIFHQFFSVRLVAGPMTGKHGRVAP
jgi:hypothetical protein